MGILLNNRLISFFFGRNHCHFDLKYFIKKTCTRNSYILNGNSSKLLHGCLLPYMRICILLRQVMFPVPLLQNVYCFRPVHQSANHKSLHTQLLHYELDFFKTWYTYLFLKMNSHIGLTI